MIIRTENSTYEVDQINKRIRRTNGKHVSTSRQGNDLEWKPYTDINIPKVGEALFIVWGFGKDGDGNTRAKSTMTSIVTFVDANNNVS